MLRRSRYERRTEQIFCTRSEKWSENWSSRFEPKILLISFSRVSGPPLKCDPVTLPHLVVVSHPQNNTHFIHVCSVCNISSQSSIHTGLTAAWALPSVNPQPWHFTNNSLGFPHAPSLSVCLFLWVCVVCVCCLLYLSFSLGCARCVFGVRVCIHNHLFVFCFLFLHI